MHMQSTIAVSKLVTNLLDQNDSNLRKSLSTIATFVSQDEKVKVCVYTSLIVNRERSCQGWVLIIYGKIGRFVVGDHVAVCILILL